MCCMSEAAVQQVDFQHLHEDMLLLQREVSVIRHILSEEGKLTDWAKKALAKAREEPESSYVNLEDV